MIQKQTKPLTEELRVARRDEEGRLYPRTPYARRQGEVRAA